MTFNHILNNQDPFYIKIQLKYITAVFIFLFLLLYNHYDLGATGRDNGGVFLLLS